MVAIFKWWLPLFSVGLSAVLGMLPTAYASNNRLATIQASQQLNVCIWPDYYAISYRNPRTHKLVGIDIDLAQELAKDLKVKIQFVDSSFARFINDLNADKCDIAMFAIGITPSRTGKVLFTQPYLASDVYGITTKTNRKIVKWEDIDQPGIVVSVAKGTLHEPLLKENLKHAQLLVGIAPHARDRDVESGRADVFMTDFPYTTKMLQTTNWARLIKPDQPYHITNYAWAVKTGEINWLKRVNLFMTTIKKDGRLYAAAKEHQLDSIVID